MIIVRLFGGLGNQMFQYAAARRLAYKHKTNLKLDIIPLTMDGYRRYALHCFNIQESFAGAIDAFRFYPIEGLKRIGSKMVGEKVSNLFFSRIIKDRNRRLTQRYYNYDPASKQVVKLVMGRIVSQRFFHFDPDVLELPDDVYMMGSWISEKYFSDIKPVILEEFRFKSEQSLEEKNVSTMIRHCESVSIHIRRGDFIKELQNQAAYNIIGQDYFNECIDYMLKKLKTPKFFIFSDDMDWVKKNFRIQFPTHYVEHKYNSNGYCIDLGSGFQDMRLMSECKHNIITNSTFSWWGAWLNRNPDKTVCAPKEFVRIWNFDNKDILPDEWIKF